MAGNGTDQGEEVPVLWITRERDPEPCQHPPPLQQKEAFAPPHARDTDEWGKIIPVDNVQEPPPSLTKTEEIKLLIRSLTYGEMMEMCAEVWAKEILTKDEAPAALWRWAKGEPL
jgi:hypothetical protein